VQTRLCDRKDRRDFAGSTNFLALAVHRILGLHCDFRRRGTSAHGCSCAPTAICSTPVGRTRCRIRIACSSHVGAYYSGASFCRCGSVCLPSTVCWCGVARTLPVSSRSGSGCYCLRDEQLFRRRLGGALCGPALQQSLSILAISVMAAASRDGTELAMDDTGNRSPPRHRNDPPGDGNILRHPWCHPPCARAVLWYRVLDWFLDQYTDRRALASITGRTISNRKDGNAFGVIIGTKRSVKNVWYLKSPDFFYRPANCRPFASLSMTNSQSSSTNCRHQN
jgi:hypothetical protein